jgi:hypothetical protein
MLDRPEAAAVVEHKVSAAPEEKDHCRMGCDGPVSYARSAGMRRAGKRHDAARHTQVDPHHGTIIHIEQHILGSPPGSLDALPREPLSEAGRSDCENVSMKHLNALDAAPRDGRPDASDDGLGLGQFWH